MKVISKPNQTIRQKLVKVKNKIPEEKNTGVVYEVPYQDCDHVYVGEMSRTLKKRLSEHKQAVKNTKNGIAVHSH